MASKIYIVKKDGEVLQSVKGLAKAKEAADKAGAEVFDGEKCVYRGIVSDDVSSGGADEPDSVSGGTVDGRNSETPVIGEDTASEDGQADADVDTDESELENTDVSSLPPDQISEDKKTTEVKAEVRGGSGTYRLKALMNVREKPSKDARIIGTKAEGTVVNVKAIENDWLCLTDGTYILYENGRFAEKE